MAAAKDTKGPAKENRAPAPKMQTNAAPSPPIQTHAAPRRKGPAAAPSKSCSSAIKSAWRRNKQGMSLREFARKHSDNDGSDWLRNKGVRDVGSKR